MPRVTKLGRGLSSLIGESVRISIGSSPTSDNRLEATQAAEPAVGGRVEPQLVMVGVDQLVASPFQPRREFDEGALAGLAESIKTAGVMQPVVVRAVRGGGYELIAGERRWRAARLAGLASVPAVVVELTDVEAAEWALIENVQREDLGALERAAAYRNLAERFGLTHAEIGEKLGLDRSVVANYIRLLDLEPALQDYLTAERLSVGHAKVLLGLPGGPQREALGERTVREGWTVRRLEREVEAARGGAAVGGKRKDETREIAVRDIEKQLAEQLGTKVQIVTKAGGKKGRVVIEFYSLDHFDGLMARMGVRLGV